MPVIGYQIDKLPAFFSRDSGFGGDYRPVDAACIARVMRAMWSLRLGLERAGSSQGGLLVANPIPAEFALAREVIDVAIAAALADPNAQGVRSTRITPFLLDRVNALTGGDSLAANIALALNNARLVAAVALALCVNRGVSGNCGGRLSEVVHAR